jgi:hypothetical protein
MDKKTRRQHSPEDKVRILRQCSWGWSGCTKPCGAE